MRKKNEQELGLSACGCWRGLFMLLLALIQTMQLFPSCLSLWLLNTSGTTQRNNNYAAVPSKILQFLKKISSWDVMLHMFCRLSLEDPEEAQSCEVLSGCGSGPFHQTKAGFELYEASVSEAVLVGSQWQISKNYLQSILVLLAALLCVGLVKSCQDSARNMLQFAPVCYLTVAGNVTLGRSNNRLRAEISIQKLNWLQPDHSNPVIVLSEQKETLSPSLFSGCSVPL